MIREWLLWIGALLILLFAVGAFVASDISEARRQWIEIERSGVKRVDVTPGVPM